MEKIDLNEVNRLVFMGLLKVVPSETFPGLATIKYDKRVFFKNLWDVSPLLHEARGLVYEQSTGDIVVHPFTKVFNLGESSAPVIPADSPVVLHVKHNGFMGAVTYDNRGWIYSTTGRTEGKFVDYIKEMVDVQQIEAVHGRTYLFEVHHPEDPHIIAEEPGSVLIGIRDGGRMFSPEEVNQYADLHGIKRAEIYPDPLRMYQVADVVKSSKLEGFMVYELDANGNYTGRVVKAKTPYYLFAKAAARRGDIEKAIRSAQYMCDHIDEEFYQLIDKIKENQAWYDSANEQERLDFIRENLQ